MNAEIAVTLGRIRSVLLEDWDPIGIRGIPGAADEYDSYAMPIYSILRQHRSEEALLDYLENHRHKSWTAWHCRVRETDIHQTKSKYYAYRVWGPPEDHLATVLRTVGVERFLFGTGQPLRLPIVP